MKARFLNPSQIERELPMSLSKNLTKLKVSFIQTMMHKVIVSAAILVVLIASCPSADASFSRELIKAIGRFVLKETGQEVNEQALKKLTQEVGEELIERTGQKLVREGGEKSLVEVSELVAKHGPDVIQAIDNVPKAGPVLELLKKLPDEDIRKAASRLAAGSTGKDLASISQKIGVVALRADVQHPGVGLRFANQLGTEGAELSLKLTSDQAHSIGKHVGDIAELPPEQQSKLLEMIAENADRFAAFVGRFLENNPGKVLFTAASTPIILANSDAIFGAGEIVFDAQGNPVLDPKGKVIRENKGILPEASSKLSEAAIIPVLLVLFSVGIVFVVYISLLAASKLWKHQQKDRLDVEIARRNAENRSVVRT